MGNSTFPQQVILKWEHWKWYFLTKNRTHFVFQSLGIILSNLAGDSMPTILMTPSAQMRQAITGFLQNGQISNIMMQ